MRAHDKVGRYAVLLAYRNLPFFARVFVFLRLLILPLEEVEQLVLAGTVLDIGCGYGLLSHYMAQRDMRRTVVGIERDPLLVARANATVSASEKLVFIEGDAATIALDAYDCIVMCDLLHHLPAGAQERLIRVAREALNPRGRIIIKDIEKENMPYYYWNLFHDRVMRLSGPTFHRSADEWGVMLRGHGLRLVEIRHFYHLLYHHVCIVAEKE